MTARRPKNAPRTKLVAPDRPRGAQPPSPGTSPVTPAQARGGRLPCYCVHAYQGNVEVRVAQHQCPEHGPMNRWRLVGLPPWLKPGA